MEPFRVAFLGPVGTFSSDALRAAPREAEVELVEVASIHEAVMSVAEGSADRALVPFENSIEGSVRPTLDALAFDAEEVTIAGEHDHPIVQALIARKLIELEEIEAVISHPQPLAQCARYLRAQLPRASVRHAASTAEAVRAVVGTDRPWAAIGPASAADIHGGVILAEGIEDESGNVTRFAWLAPAGAGPSRKDDPSGSWRTTLIFSELGADHPGALVEALTAFSERAVNLTRIESRPRRYELGRYMFFCDLDGAASDEPVAAAIADLRTKAENVRVLGSYPTAGPPLR